MEDVFGARALRERVLRAWAESPARFREDANAEEDHALGGYRDRLVIELAQNAADAARRAAVPGHLRLTLSGTVLTAANTGAPLDAAGVESLSTLRASSKRDDTRTAGRFGVGFAAVVAVTDTPAIASRMPPDVDHDGGGQAASGAVGGRAGGVAGVEWSSV
ncbi:sacsin N-terminal ATP-binding-like domain-containing protein, partial [Actinomadura darangshiensis]|uniref:sacsin N-terminal ATP-binding-like domain-containing protein n=1 Tax=Actinomadura darangshiensis TaxID=705336 RepID=UPI003C7B4512